MRQFILAVCLLLVLSGCGILTAPARYIDERLQRDDDVFNRHGLELDRVEVGDSRETVREEWGTPRNTHPTYHDFDVYLGIRNSDGDWRVLPGSFDDLHRTRPLVVKVSYVDDHVNAIFLFGQDAFGNSRAWCDDTSLCAELFPFHSSTSEDAPTNPMIVSVREPGFDVDERPDGSICELVVFTASEPASWVRSLNFVELVASNRSMGFLSPATYHVSHHPTGALALSVWPNFAYNGDSRQALRDSWMNTLDLSCEAGGRHFVEVGAADTGLFTLDQGLQVNEVDEASALPSLAVRRAIVSSSIRREPAGTPSPQDKAHPQQ